MSKEEILEKLTSTHWVDNGKVCIYTRRIPSFVYPFAEGRKEGFADTLRIVIYVEEGVAFEYLNDIFHRNVETFEANTWVKWAKKQKEGVEK